jgi:hypothetical protein
MSETMLREPTEAHLKLNVLVDHWRAEGQPAGDPRASAIHGGSADAGSEEIHEWMPSGFFLVHRWDATVGDPAFKGTEILGYEPARGDYFTRFFDASGNQSECTASVDGNILKFKDPNTRATVAVTDEGTSLDIAWELRDDGSNWLPLCDLLSRRKQRSQDAH